MHSATDAVQWRFRSTCADAVALLAAAC